MVDSAVHVLLIRTIKTVDEVNKMMQIPLSPSVNLDIFFCHHVGAGDHASMCKGKKRRF